MPERRLRLTRLLLATLLLGLLPSRLPRLLEALFEVYPWDYAINWTAAQAMERGLSLYDRGALRTLSVELAAPPRDGMFQATFHGYIGPPTTALFLVPFTSRPFAQSARIYRVTVLALFLFAIALGAFSLPPEDRLTGWLLGALTFLAMMPTCDSIGLGQVDGWIAAGLAIALWAAPRGRWSWAGLGLALATLLKISPGLAIAYLVARGKWKVAAVAVAAGGAALAAAAALAAPGDLLRFIREVLPAVSRGSFGIENQSLPAFLGRVVLPDPRVLNFEVPLGRLSLLAGAVALVLCALVVRVSRSHVVRPLELGLVVLAALLSGPVTWDSYSTWAVVFVIPLADRTLWRGLAPQSWLPVCVLLLAGGFLFSLPLLMGPAKLFSPESIELNGSLRLLTGVRTCALLCWFAAGWRLLALNMPPPVSGGVSADASAGLSSARAAERGAARRTPGC